MNTQQKRATLRTIKEQVGCVDCGVKYPYYVLQFDHRPGTVKIDNVSRLISNASWEQVLTEIEKCDIVCGNCHTIREHNRRVQ